MPRILILLLATILVTTTSVLATEALSPPVLTAPPCVEANPTASVLLAEIFGETQPAPECGHCRSNGDCLLHCNSLAGCEFDANGCGWCMCEM